jgi:hypothetical protein
MVPKEVVLEGCILVSLFIHFFFLPKFTGFLFTPFDYTDALLLFPTSIKLCHLRVSQNTDTGDTDPLYNISFAHILK